MTRLRLGTLGLVITLATTPLSGQSQPTGRDTVAAPGPEYRASALHRFLLGSEYRSLWYTPVTVEVLDLDRFAGGLQPVSKGGGFQTKSLRLAAPDGHEFFFRSVDKDPSATLPPELRDQTKAALPTAPLVVDRLLTAAGLLHAKTRLVVLPREGLGEFTDEFAGLMGTLDERVGGVEGPSSHWHGALEI